MSGGLADPFGQGANQDSVSPHSGTEWPVAREHDMTRRKDTRKNYKRYKCIVCRLKNGWVHTTVMTSCEERKVRNLHMQEWQPISMPLEHKKTVMAMLPCADE